MTRRLSALCLVAAAVACAAAGGEADVQDLLPADAIVAACYYGDSTDLEQTALYQLLEEPEVREWMASLRQTVAGANQLAATFLRVNLAQLKPLVGCRIGLAVLPSAQGGQAPPDVLLVVKVGDAEAPARRNVAGLLGQLGALTGRQAPKLELAGIEVTKLGAGPVGLLYGFRGDYLLAATSQAALERALGGQGPTVAGVAAFQRAAQMGGSPVALVLYNHVAVMERFGALAPPQALAVMRELGLNEVRTVGFRLGARGRALVSTLFAQTAGERRGLLEIVASEPVDRELLKLIPRDAAIASASNLEPRALYDAILAVAQVLTEGQGVDARETVARFEAQAGIRLRDDLFGAFGRGTVVTTSAESLLPAVVISQAVADAGKLDKALAALVAQLDALIRQQRGPEAGAALKAVPFGDHTIRYLVTPGLPVPLAPCYAMVEGRAAFALTPIHLKDYLLFLDGAEPSLLENAGYLAMAKAVPRDAVTISYSDFGGAFVEAYRMLGPLLTMAHGIPRNPVAIDLANMPSTRTLRKHLFGSVSYTYATDDMVVWEVHSPLGVDFAGPVPAALAAGAAAGVALPAIARARTAARGVQSLNNLKQISVACIVYANDHEDALPASLGALFEAKLLDDAALLVAPNDPAPQPAGGRATSYRYLLDEQPGLKLKLGAFNKAAMVPLAWERQSFGRRVRNVVFADGHAEAMAEADFQERLARIRNWLHKKMEEQKGEF